MTDPSRDVGGTDKYMVYLLSLPSPIHPEKRHQIYYSHPLPYPETLLATLYPKKALTP